MKKYILLSVLIAAVIFIHIAPVAAQDQIEFDGYWWATATPQQKLGYVQGFIDGAGGMSYIFMNIIAEAKLSSSEYSPKEKQAVRAEMRKWQPYNRRFGYYMERIEAFYKSTLAMKTPVSKIMMDLMESP